ncbi:MAG: hypothetical protein VKP62_13180 [Candidatus Sericytochromatia bacterium]|nr:hypothetical protein [Candidatus Sericytochromatia bacterium]
MTDSRSTPTSARRGQPRAGLGIRLLRGLFGLMFNWPRRRALRRMVVATTCLPAPARPLRETQAEETGLPCELPQPQLLLAPLTPGELQSLREWIRDGALPAYTRVLGPSGRHSLIVELVVRDADVGELLDTRITELKAQRRWLAETSQHHEPDQPTALED